VTERQQQIIALVTEGLTNREIAERMGITENIVKNELRDIYDATGHSNRVELALWWIKNHELDI
jgi:DNA-binding NarL/FixJ family response regulator